MISELNINWWKLKLYLLNMLLLFFKLIFSVFEYKNTPKVRGLYFHCML